MRLTLINHACVKLQSGAVGVLCDPWLEGTAFNDGWSLLVPTPLSNEQVMEGVTHIWLSHEHPDHFSPKFFSQIAARHAGKVEILFQKTRDGRVRKFCESKGFKVREIADGETVELGGGVRATIGTWAPYDSWMLLRDGTHSVMNVNDVPLIAAADVERVKAVTGPIDVLLTQFSYAAWKGGRDNRAFRETAARQKLETVELQTRILAPKAVIPFASYVYFSHPQNFYLNDSVNTPAIVARTIAAVGAEPVVLYPGDAWETGQAHDNAPALARYDALYGGLNAMPLVEGGPGVTLEALHTKFAGYRNRVFAKNSRFLITVGSKVPVVSAFRPVNIRVTDLGVTLRVSVVTGIAQTAEPADLSMDSNSLAFVFDNDFGFDTLTVNGRFEASPQGFSKFVRSFGVGALNAMGLTVSWSLLLQGRVMLGMFKTLFRVMGQLRKPAPA